MLRFCDISLAQIGIHATDSNSTIENCHIHDCNTYGIFWDSETQTKFGLVHQTVIENNGHSGLRCNAPIRSQDGGIVSECAIQGNGSWGIHISASSGRDSSQTSEPSVKFCSIINNGSGGIYLNGRSSLGSATTASLSEFSEVGLDITGCYVFDNKGPGISCGAWGLSEKHYSHVFRRRAYTSPRLDRCLIYANSGSGLNIHSRKVESYAFPTISHSCFYNNGNHEIYADGEDVSIALVNSIISTPHDNYFDLQNGGVAVTSYCLFDGIGTVPEGEGNLQGDPQWVGPENGDFRLRVTSPAIDAGKCPAEGECTYKGLAPDLGALEIDLKLPHNGLE